MGRSRDLADGTLAELNVDSNTLAVDATNDRVGIGTSSPSSILHLSSTGSAILTIEADTDNVTETDNARIELSQDGGAVTGRIGYGDGINSIQLWNNYSDAGLLFGTNNTERMRIDSSGNVGINTSSPSVPLDVNGITRTANAYSISYAGVPGSTSAFGAGTISADSNWGMYFRATTGAAVANFAWVNGTGSEYMRIDTSGNVGIGTSIPTGKLDIRGGSGATGVQSYFSSDAGYAAPAAANAAFSGGTKQVFWNDTVTPQKLSMGMDANATMWWANLGAQGGGASTAGGFNWYTSQSGAGSPNLVMRITSSGNVGIGTTSPSSKLEVAGGADSTIRNTASSGSSWFAGTNTSSYILHNASNTPMVFTTNGTERMRIDSSGNVGIGTTSPSTALDVNGQTLTLSGAGTADRHIEIGVGRTGNGNSYVDLIGDTTYTDYGARFIRYNGGANAATRLDHRGTGELSMWATDAGALQFGTSNTERMRIDSSGNVGIGTSSPTNKLTVTGGILEIRDGNILMMRPSGNAWDMRLQAVSQRLDVISGGDTTNPIATFVHGGNVGIGTSSPSYKLHVSGDIYATGNVTAYSDIKLKENIKTVENAVDLVNKMRGVTFTRKDTGEDGVGVIAQEMQKVLPQVVTEKDGIIGVAYGNIVGVLIEAVKELSAEVKRLKGQ